ncbi:KINESIN-LIKE PROTEIN KIN-5D [Salix koriyanagi]|uniref:Kinesin-like protein n=1 Tax=Salix koriyanagi TaxID=2511006 RepID=A0A9Q0X3U8_9ROSI|nr:KINESIN-LIKE PROTEIN KIN-5D [Salix koriyanagi]
MDHSQQQKRCNTVLLSPAQTPRSSVRRSLRDSLSMDLWGSNVKPDRGVNVEVILRCRPLNDDEKELKLPVVISCHEDKGEVSVVQNTAYKQIDKTFSFDKVFGPTSQQKELFDEAISPIVNEVLEGYNCTIFAYGQTGTGKTYTMEGGRVGVVESGEFPRDVGIIPRAVQQIFDVLEARDEDYSMKVTFLELYNEDIMDLLAPDESLNGPDDKSRKPIALMEDGRGGVFIRGLEQEVVCTADRIYKILEKGSAKRHTADSLLNMQSSRSHTIFSITIHVKESSSNGEELMKCGKLNLVDLAGSENVVRSGAKEGRVREAGEINKSLLTLGRVINALVEHSGHVPYRDSKLTRLLRDSLGGNTKTCIIATVSPSIHSLEETLNTLDYAHRAKKIKNRPEVNQRVAKSELIKDLYKEIERLRQEIYDEREKNGIYTPHDRFQIEEAERKALAEQIKSMEFDLVFKDKELMGLQKLYDTQQTLTAELSEKLQMTQKDLEKTQNTLLEIEGRNRKANATIKEKEHLISHLLQSEKSLTKQASELREELEHVASEASNLFSKLEQQDKLENGNKNLVQKFQTHLAKQLDVLHQTVAASVTQQEEHLKSMEKDFDYSLSKKMGGIQELTAQVRHLKKTHESGIKSLNDISEELDMSYRSAFSNLTSEVSRNSSALVGHFEEKFLEINDILDDIQRDLFNQQEKLAEFAEQQRQGHSKTLQLTRSMSEAMMKFFETLGTHTSSLTPNYGRDPKNKWAESSMILQRSLRIALLLRKGNSWKK